MKNKINQNGGITLVALVITVIITLILAGVGISLITGENGLFTKANHAASEYNSKAQSEATKFNQLMNYLNGNYGSGDGASQGGGAQTVTYTVVYDANEGTGAPSNDTKTQGTDLTLSATVPTRSGYKFLGWSEDQNATTATYQSGGTYNTDASTTMYAVWMQLDPMTNNMTLAVAKTKDEASTNVTIKAPLNAGGTADQDVVIPAGFILATDTGNYVNEGIVIKNATDGNEFVWIPVANSTAYTKTAFKGETLATSNTGSGVYYESQPTDEANSINSYHGFYFGRYEAGSKEDTEAKTMRTAGTEAKTVTVQKDQVPYNLVAINSIKAGSGKGNMTDLAATLGNGYRTTYGGTIKTKLCSSYAWDTALNFVGDSNWARGTDDPTIAQNYSNAPSFEYKKFNNGTIETATRPANSTSSIGIIATGQGTATKNIYDMGGNCWEYTSESYSNTNFPCVLRGGVYYGTFASYPAGNRYYNYGDAGNYSSFRLTLFL